MTNNIVEFEGRASIERQAREWLIRLDGDEPLTAAESEALREWTSRSPAHRAELRRISELWKQANVLTELAVPLHPRAQGHRIAARLKPGRRVALAAGLLAALALGWLGLQRLDRAANGTYGTVIGRQQNIALPDGSSVQLNTDSQAQVSYSDHLRSIRLLRGEAFFSVKPDPRRPFEVEVANTVVRAVGTAFAVRLESNAVNVTVTTGTVQVTATELARAAPDATRQGDGLSSRVSNLVKAGQMSVVSAADSRINLQELTEPQLQHQVSWREGYLVFSGQPLSEVVEQVNRYSAVAVEIGDPQLASVPIGGRFRVGDLEAVLDVLRTNFGIESHRIDDHDIRLESRARR